MIFMCPNSCHFQLKLSRCQAISAMGAQRDRFNTVQSGCCVAAIGYPGGAEGDFWGWRFGFVMGLKDAHRVNFHCTGGR